MLPLRGMHTYAYIDRYTRTHVHMCTYTLVYVHLYTLTHTHRHYTSDLAGEPSGYRFW
jgi:hypothetical protein